MSKPRLQGVRTLARAILFLVTLSGCGGGDVVGPDEGPPDEGALPHLGGPHEIYRMNADGSGVVRLSDVSGFEPAWSLGGGELVYRAPASEPGQRRVMAVDVTTEPDFLAGSPRVLYQESTARGSQAIRGYGIALDGRFLKVAVDPALVNELLQREPIPPQPRTHVHVVSNWFDELQRLVPTP